MTATVAVLGGGYGGMAVARALDDVAAVVLVEPRDAFVHNVAALRGVVDREWTDRLFYRYDRLLERGRVVRDRAVRVSGTEIALGSGQTIEADYVVLATGSSYPFPAKIDALDSAGAKDRLHATRDSLERADRVLLLGAGPVGLEFAGEIRAVWPEKAVTIVDPAGDVLPAFPAEFRSELRRQLEELRIELVMGTSLREQPPSEPGEHKTFTATTGTGAEITADIWFRCFGVEPATGYLAGDLAAARTAAGHVEVTSDLRVPGQERVFAIGDITALPEAKMAKSAGDHADVVAANIRALINGGGEPLTTYEPAPPMIALPLGPKGGVSYTADTGVLGPDVTSEIKGADLRAGHYAELLG
ncbi:FAD-dependent oxidoreductase [Saccharopolyspora erythraea]|uniref:FAD-dependent oxidoreductase n=1 Tax=Saccharopolyspora erythraea TaxID=1836 RepID=UPI001BA7184B|nr:FAD-dependent oxidoreductase [Saccharopolyspora erythraea]QUG99768.1 FAD-dependent oxidoreductase [Saccharopolyspora erythraea]